MADSEPRGPPDETVEYDDESRLKYLEIVEVLTIYAAAICRRLYEFGKENSGPLRPGVETVEDTVRAVLGPVWDKFHHVPFDLLRFMDHKVDEYIRELERRMPSLLKQVSEHARAVATDVHNSGAVDAVMGLVKTTFEAYQPVAKDLYVRYEPVAEEYAVWGLRHLNQLPLFQEMAHVVIPTAAYWAERYNEKVCYGAESGYAAARYLPLVPIDGIAKIFEEAERGPEVSVSTEASDAVAMAQ